MTKHLTSIARKLRKSLTPQELTLWLILRRKEFKHLKFRRQYVIENHIVDFCCPEKKLIIEVDGGQHAEGKQMQKDFQRDEFLKSRGFTVIRFWNNEVDENLDGIIQKIDDRIK